MTKARQQSRHALKATWSSHRLSLVRSILIVAVFTAIGFFTVHISHAAGYATSTEAESGQLSGKAMSVAKDNASGTKAVLFGQAAVPAPATPPTAAPTPLATPQTAAPTTKATPAAKPAATPAPAGNGTTAASTQGWGQPDSKFSDEFNGKTVDSKWYLFGGRGQCVPGYAGNGQRCGDQVSEGNGLITIEGTLGGKQSGVETFKGVTYGRIEVRERAYCADHCNNAPYHAVPLTYPVNKSAGGAGEIDFAERDIGSPTNYLFIHPNAESVGGQLSCSTKVDSTKWHNYAIDWEPHSVTWYIDGQQICQKSVSMSESCAFDPAQLDMTVANGTAMQHDYEQADWIHYYPVK